MRHLKDEGMRHITICISFEMCNVIAKKEQNVYHLFWAYYNYGTQLWSGGTNFAKIGMFLLYIFKATYTLYLGP